MRRKPFLGNNFLSTAGDILKFSWIRHDISSRSYYDRPAQFCARRSFRWDGGETRADYLIMPDAVYLGVQKETKEAAWRNVLAIPDLYCDAPRRERRRPPENCQTEKSTVAFFLDISGASQLRRLSNWHAGITADAATSSSPPLNSSFLPANVVSSRDTISPLCY